MSDAQPVSAPPGLPYGNRQQLEQSQQVVPMAGSPAPPRPSPTSGGGGGVQLPGKLAPGEVPTLEDPSAYPGEPVTAGLPTGPGAGPESLLVGAFGSESLSLLRAVYAQYKDEDVRRLIEQTELGL